MTFKLNGAQVLLLFLAVVSFGCSKDKLNELMDKTKQKVTEGADSVQKSVANATGNAKEQLSLSGKADFQLDVPVTTVACYASFLHIGQGRPNVLQIRSYKDAGQESFPSMFLQAQVPATGVGELIGQVVKAQLFVQSETKSPVWHSAPGTYVELKVVSSDDKTLVAEITGSVRNTDSDAQQNVTGKLTAVW